MIVLQLILVGRFALLIGARETPSALARCVICPLPRLYYYYSANNWTVYTFNLKLKYSSGGQPQGQDQFHTLLS